MTTMVTLGIILAVIGLVWFLFERYLDKVFSKAFSNILDFDLNFGKKITEQASMRDE